MPAASLSHYASLSFVVIGSGQWEDCGLRICPSDSHPSGGFPVSDCGFKNRGIKEFKF